LQLIPFLAENPNVDIRKLTEEVVSGMGLSRRIIIPQAELEAMQQEQMAQQGAMAQAEAQASLGGAAGGEAYIQQQQIAQIQQMISQMSPEDALRMKEALAQQTGIDIPLPEDALPAGGGAPVREGEA
jgi:hypothetical protein